MSIPNSLNSIRIPDFNGDGRTDLFNYNRSTGETSLNTVFGSQISESRSLLTIPVSDEWEEPDYGDFNGDGRTDLLWRSTTTGQNGIWLINNGNLTHGLIDPLDGALESVVGDFNGDRKSDIFWYKPTSGFYTVWIMDGLNRVDEVTGFVEGGWQPSLADFNDDDTTDLFWNNPNTGENAVWIFENGAPISQNLIQTFETTWLPQIIDLNNDGRSDVFWRNRITGQNIVWEWSDDGNNRNWSRIDLPSASSDTLLLTADFNGDGRTDFLGRNPSSGANQVWLSTGSGVDVITIANQSAELFPTIGDFNGDRFSDIRWTRAGLTDSFWFSDGSVPRSFVS